MTDLQKKIRKTSGFTARIFGYMAIFPAVNATLSLVGIYQALRGAAGLQLKHNGLLLNTSPLQIILFALCTLMIYGLAAGALMIARNIFYDISEEYTPFKPLHVTRMRRIALLSTICIVGQALVEAWSIRLRGGSSGLDLNLAYFLIPLAVWSFSFILDYACQLQAEADTTL